MRVSVEFSWGYNEPPPLAARVFRNAFEADKPVKVEFENEYARIAFDNMAWSIGGTVGLARFDGVFTP